MKKVSIFLAPGFEEVEALTPIDLLRRAGAQVTIVSVQAEKAVTGSHQITVEADTLFEDMDFEDQDLLILPGGQPGTNNLKACQKLRSLLADADKKGKLLAAICAAPAVFGDMGLLKGKKATCYPGCEEGLVEAEYLTERVVTDGNLITSRGVGTAIPFGLSLIEQLFGKEKSEEIRKSIIYGH
ncbi:MAG: DJ-1/PfpI family protein [Lachnospiraceae bacterium]|nr:DJ-1/PfpI family protein [Lachnospiraceae bacterium]